LSIHLIENFTGRLAALANSVKSLNCGIGPVHTNSFSIGRETQLIVTSLFEKSKRSKKNCLNLS
jgi:hypothetical protein